MIDEICVHNIALIEEASILPSPGMTAITGETGTGKTALLNSCKLIMGQRSDKDLIREGADHLSVQARFYAGRPDEGTDADDEEELIVSRSIASDGRSRVKISGEIASVSELKDVVAPLMDLCSQHDQQLLMKPAMQRRFLDLWAGEAATEKLEAYERAYDAVREAERAMEELISGSSVSEAQLEDAHRALGRIEALDPTEEDYTELLDILKRSENAELLGRVMDGARDALSGENGVLDELNQAVVLLEDGAKADHSLAGYANTLRDAGYAIEDVARDVSRYLSAVDLDVGVYEEMQARVADYQGLLRTHGPAISDVLEAAEGYRRTIRMAEDFDLLEASARAKLTEAEERLTRAAADLTTVRANAAPEFSDAVTAVMAELDMGSAVLECRMSAIPREHWTRGGADRVELMFRPAAGMQPRPLSRIASGGELSRVILSLHAAMGERDQVPTLVFDEVDAGVGGATAAALGGVLRRLALTHQVLVVTHLAQVAAQADKQYVVSKSERRDHVATEIVEVRDEQRLKEIARMLSGSDTETARAHAAELLAASGRDRF